MTFKQISFTGDYSQLKTMGFKFQKLYAANYMQWHHEESGIHIWKKGADVTINCVTGMEGQLLQMMLDKVEFTMKKSLVNIDHCYYVMYKNNLTNTLHLDGSRYKEESKNKMQRYNRDSENYNPSPDIWSALSVNLHVMSMLQKFIELDWVKVTEIDGEHFVDDDE